MDMHLLTETLSSFGRALCATGSAILQAIHFRILELEPVLTQDPLPSCCYSITFDAKFEMHCLSKTNLTSKHGQHTISLGYSAAIIFKSKKYFVALKIQLSARPTRYDSTNNSQCQRKCLKIASKQKQKHR